MTTEAVVRKNRPNLPLEVRSRSRRRRSGKDQAAPSHPQKRPQCNPPKQCQPSLKPTSNLGGHLKSGQWWSPQNRPMRTQSGQVIVLPCRDSFGKSEIEFPWRDGHIVEKVLAQRGMHKGAQPSCGGSRCTGRASVVCWRRHVRGVGGTRPPRLFPRKGETGKGELEFLAAAGDLLAHVVLAGIALVRQLRGPHLRTWPWWRSRSSIELTAAVSPSSFPQSSTGRFEVSKVLVRS
jgi:hypothetical protein